MFNLEQAVKAQGGAELQFYSFFNLSANLEWVLNTTARLLYPQQRDPIPIL